MSTSGSSARLPALFVGHGSPMNTLEDNRYTRAWRELGARLPRPRAILMVSAHWLTRGTALHVGARPPTIHDFRGFPPELFAMQYPAPGLPALYDEVAAALAPTTLLRDEEWGLDHGAWSILVHLFPKADVPVVQLSLDVDLDARGHYALGQRLTGLRERGILVMGSGNIVHNLAAFRAPGAELGFDWARRFDGQIVEALTSRQHERLVTIETQGMDARLSVPTPDHYWPLLYVAGASRADEPGEVCVSDPAPGAVSMTSWMTGT